MGLIMLVIMFAILTFVFNIQTALIVSGILVLTWLLLVVLVAFLNIWANRR